MKKTFVMAFASLFSVGVYATECTTIGHTDGKRHEIKAMLNSYTQIELPENIMEGTKPLVGNDDLWEKDHAGPHLFIKPTSEHELGKTTSFSAVGESGKSYSFKVVRYKNIDNNCYKLADGVLFNDDQRKLLTKKKDNSSAELARLWKEKYMREQRSADDDTQKAVLEALRRYRYQIYTRYNWKKSGYSSDSEGFIGNNFVSDVYDDGRFTYIRVGKQNRGLMMVEATLEGQTEIIEAKYDTLNKMYTISGIFPQFTLKYGKTKVKIKRADNATVGEY